MAVPGFYVDRSPAIQHLVKERFQGDSLSVLGELQLAFILFMVGENLEAFRKWKRLFYALCRCESFAESNPEFYAEAARCIFTMLKQFPQDFFYDVISRENFVKTSIINFVQIGGELGDAKSQKRSEAVARLISERFAIEVPLAYEEEGEYAPVMVEDPSDFVSFN